MVAVTVSSAGRGFSKTPSSAAIAGREPPDGRKAAAETSCYYPGCRKDANCHCEICLASINATLDLIPPGCSSIQQRSSITKLSSSSSSATSPLPVQRRQRTPLPAPAFSPSRTTERSDTGSTPSSPPLHSTAKSRPSAKDRLIQTETRSSSPRLPGFNRRVLRFFLGLCFLLAADYGFPAVVQWSLGGPRLSPEIVKTAAAGEQSQATGELRGSLPPWRLAWARSSAQTEQNTLLLPAGRPAPPRRCVIYESALEQLSVWGSPIQTSGAISTGLSSEPASGGAYSRWTTMTIRLEQNTWVLEYRTAGLDNSRVAPLLWELLVRAWVSGTLSEYNSGYNAEANDHSWLLPPT
ncbi:unnamed protein product [Spirodela intermedia]|uniref:Uncharacterized protein n=1 Tax=Spirodela intermedia TaxID=51605 RepID=A0A7I8I872_SPIIN|nr:unnamed protein product [Spirodela intermedia]CAA6653799.1 unnamed protein product [Spirodela intermedia]